MINTDKLKSRMSKLGITQVQLAEKLGIAAPTMCQKLNNIRPLSLEEAEILATELKIKDKEFGSYFLANSLRSAIFKLVERRNFKWNCL